MAITKVTTAMKTAPTSAEVTAHANTTPIEDDVALLGFRVASNGSLAKYNLVDQTVDDFQDATGVNTGASTNATRDATGKYFSGSSAATGGTVTTDGSYSIHTFATGTTNFITGATGNVDALLVAGGGQGGGNHHGAGGGAGGVIYKTSHSLSSGTHSIVVGAGGSSGSTDDPGANGSNSTGLGMTAFGGGGGACNAGGASAGGSGGGGASSNTTGGATTQTSNGGGTGYGYAGGNQASSYGGAGGGGAGAAGAGNGGQGGGGAAGGAGGVGISNSITGAAVFYGGGGGGGSYSGVGSYQAPGGNGGGGAYNSGNNTAGTDGLGGGGGGNGGYHTSGGGAVGGAGTAKIRFLTGSLDSIVDMTLISATTAAQAEPTKGDIVLTYTNGAGTTTLDTDLTAEISADGGSTWTDLPLASEGSTGSHNIATSHDITIDSTITAPYNMAYRIKTLNQSASKETRIQAVSLGWS